MRARRRRRPGLSTITLRQRRAALRLAYPGRDTGGWDANAYDPKVERILRTKHKRTR